MTTYERIVEAMKAEQIDVSDVKPDTKLVELADSLEFASLIIELESSFGIEITDDEVKKLFTVQDIVNYVNSDSAAK